MSIEPSPLLEIDTSAPLAIWPNPKVRPAFTPIARQRPVTSSRYESNGKEPARKRELSPVLRERVKELVQLSKEQGYLTREDVHEALSGDECSAEDLEEVFRRLRSVEIEVTETPTNRIKARAKDEDETEEVVEALDDPVRMYLKEMASETPQPRTGSRDFQTH
jgi:hypothetical protein